MTPCQACKEFKEKHVRYKDLSFDPDYDEPCTAGGTCACRTVGEAYPCANPNDCAKSNACTCSCPAPSKPNSSYVSNTCGARMDGSTCRCTLSKCQGGTCVCTCTGLCYYACDVGYVWNSVTQQCDLVPVSALPSGSNPIAFWGMLEAAWLWSRKRRRKRRIATLIY